MGVPLVTVGHTGVTTLKGGRRMKKEYTIKLVMDDSKEPGDASDTLFPVGVYDPKEYTILLNPHDSREEMLQTTAHELGHVLGRLFHTPAHMGDPRVVSNSEEARFRDFLGLETREEAEAKYRSEKEAWDFAGKMVKIDPGYRKKLLDTYK